MITADIILKTLLTRHTGDLCIPECKTGSTWTSRMFQKLDLWVMKKSWTQPWTIGYEIKCQRNDFLRDNKWQEYMKYCSDFYFVAPPDIISPNELPAEVGLLVTSKNGVRVYTKRKAVRREVEIPESIFRYILMWRTQITDERHDRHRDSVAYWKAWLEQKGEKKELGYNVSRKIRELVAEKIHTVEAENQRLKRENEILVDVKQQLKDMGIDDVGISSYRLREKIKEIGAGIPNGLENYLDRAIDNLTEVKRRIVC